MGRKTGDGLPARVREVREQVALWRRTRERRSPMPADLWTEAVGLARREGTYATARTLGLNFESLARRVAEGRAGGEDDRVQARGFVEVSGAQLLEAAGPGGPVVEVSDGSGVRLTIRLTGGAPLDVVGVVQAFCGRRG